MNFSTKLMGCTSYLIIKTNYNVKKILFSSNYCRILFYR
jgi:hypothetical protein